MIQKKVFDNFNSIILNYDYTTLFKQPELLIDCLVGSFIDPSQAIVISGFWRSGTTWLLESISKCLVAKSVFEPFMSANFGYKDYAEQVYQYDDLTRDGFMPFCKDLNNCPELNLHITRCLSGVTPDYSLRFARNRESSRYRFIRATNRIINALRTNIVVKFVRAHLILPEIKTKFGPTIIHVRRDPRAVISSLDNQKWGNWIKKMSLEKLLLAPNDNRLQIFNKYKKEIFHYDKKNYITRIAAYWALVEKRLENSLDTFTLIQFEELLQDLNKSFQKFPPSLRNHLSTGNFKKESSTTNYKPNKKNNNRIYKWKNNLDYESITQIEKVISELDMTESLID